MMKLCRSSEDSRIAGVCGGLAEYLGWDSGRLRVVWLLATIFTAFAGVIVYLALWFLMPLDEPPQRHFSGTFYQPWKKWL